MTRRHLAAASPPPDTLPARRPHGAPRARRGHTPTDLLPASAAPASGERAGFVLYVGLNGEPGADAADLAEVAEALRDLARDLLPTAETFTALSLVPRTGAADEAQSLRSRLSHLRPLGGSASVDDATAEPA